MRRMKDAGPGFGMATLGLKPIGKDAQERSLKERRSREGQAANSAVKGSIL